MALVKIQDSKAAPICERGGLPLPSNTDATPAEHVAALLAKKQYVAGIDFMANALLLREAIWWSCLTIQHAFAGTLADAEKEACRAAVRWVLNPTEEHRLMARTPAETAGPTTAAGAAALAVFIGGKPASFTSAKAITNAVKLSSIRYSPAKVVDTQRLYVGLALDIAEGRFM